MSDLRDQAVRMLVRWGEEIAMMEVRGQHPMHAIQQLALAERGRKAVGRISARGNASRRGGRSRVPIRDLSGESKRTHKILAFIGEIDARAYRALELAARGVDMRTAAEIMGVSLGKHREYLAVGRAVMVTILALRAM